MKLSVEKQNKIISFLINLEMKEINSKDLERLIKKYDRFSDINDWDFWYHEQKGSQKHISNELKSDEDGLYIVCNYTWSNNDGNENIPSSFRIDIK